MDGLPCQGWAHAHFTCGHVAQTVKNVPTTQGMQVWPLGWEGSLEKGVATYSSILVRRIPWTEVPGGPQSMGLQGAGQD